MREEVDKRFSHVMSMIQQNPVLAQIKPEVLVSKRTGLEIPRIFLLDKDKKKSKEHVLFINRQ
jgi:hypothetical protein